MNNISSTKATAMFLCRSDTDLHTLCQKMQAQFHLPNFTFGEHSTWEYAYSAGDRLAFNVTKTERLDTITTWIEGAPPGINYQIILYVYNEAGEITNVKDSVYALIHEIHMYLTKTLNTQVKMLIPRD